MTVSADVQYVFDYLFTQAAKGLATGHSFEPFATATTRAGGRTHSTTDLGSITATPAQHISALLGALKDQAGRGEIRAAGVVFNARTPQGMGGGEDSVVMHVETVAGEAVQIYVPYTRRQVPRPVYAEPVIQDVAPSIFVR
jgi:hypothetical protein